MLLVGVASRETQTRNSSRTRKRKLACQHHPDPIIQWNSGPFCECGTGFVISCGLLCAFFSGSGVEAVAGGLAEVPEVGEGVAVAEAVGPELQDCFAAGFAPEFFRALDSEVQLLDRRFHVTARDRQALFAIGGIIHAGLLVAQVRQCPGHDADWAGFAVRFLGFTEVKLAGFESKDDIGNPALPDPLDPLPVNVSSLRTRSARGGPRKNVRQGMDEIQNWHEAMRLETPFPQTPDPCPAIPHKGFAFRLKKSQLPRPRHQLRAEFRMVTAGRHHVSLQHPWTPGEIPIRT